MLQRSNITFEVAVELSSTLQRKSFWANPFFLMQNCFIKNSVLFENQGANKEPAILFFSDKYSDISTHVIGVVLDEDMPVIREQYYIDTIEASGVEFHYSSDEWSTLRGGSFAAFRNVISGFRRKYSFEVRHKLVPSECLQLVETWASSKRDGFAKHGASATDQNVIFFEEDVRESMETLRIIEALSADSLESIQLNIIGVKVSGEVVGFCIIFHLLSNYWVALMQKTNIQYRGIPQLLSQIVAQTVGLGQIITSGGYAQDANLKAFKESLRPIRKRSIYTVKLGERLSQ